MDAEDRGAGVAAHAGGGLSDPAYRVFPQGWRRLRNVGRSFETIRESLPTAGRLGSLPGFRSIHRVVAGARFRAPANRACLRGSVSAADFSVRSRGIADLVPDPDVAAREERGGMKDKALRALRELYQSNPVLTDRK